MKVTAAAASSLPGSARLSVVTVVAFGSFIFSSVLEYCLPLYFNALPGFPRGVWANLVAWQVAPWCFGPLMAGMLARKFGERRVWAAALMAQACVPLLLALNPQPWIVPPLAFWNGLTAALMWVGGVSLAQMVAPEKKGLSNGLIMTALGVGSVVGPLAGRAILWHTDLAELWRSSGVSDIGWFLINVIKPQTNPELISFKWLLWFLSFITFFNAVLMYLWGQRAGRWTSDAPHQTWGQIFSDLKTLVTDPRYLTLVVGLCLCGGVIFQVTNQFLLYRAEDLGLIVESQDRGWIVLQLIRMMMWIFGGIGVGLLAGRKTGIVTGATILGAFALAAGSIGLSSTTVQLFAASIAFEFVRQFMRWSHAGYMAAQMPDNLRATAIGGGITAAGISSTIFGFAANRFLDPSGAAFDSSKPFFFACVIGCAGALGLLAFCLFSKARVPLAEDLKIPNVSS
jgi:MFS family permease